MNLNVFKVLDKSVNAIMVVELPSLKVISENIRAKELVSINDAPIRMSTLFFSVRKAEALMTEVLQKLEYEENVRFWDTEVMGSDRNNMPCDISFSYVNDDKTHIFLKIRPILDNKTYYLEKFIDTRKRPAFTMNRTGEFLVGLGNESFYRAFACNKETIRTRYKSEFVRFLQAEGRKQTEAKIRNAISKSHHGIIDVPIQTAYGDTLFFYYDTKKLRQLEKKEEGNLMFCLLVNPTDTIEDLDDPFDM